MSYRSFRTWHGFRRRTIPRQRCPVRRCTGRRTASRLAPGGRRGSTAGFPMVVAAPMKGTAMSESTTAGPGPAAPGAAAEDATVRPFRASVPEEELDDLRRRIAATHWPSRELVTDRSQGVQLAMIQELARFWETDYDWRKAEARLNALPQFETEIDGVNIHFIHVRSQHDDAMPLIMTHGWPGSVVELLESVGPLTDPTAHGGQAEDAFHLVLPSLPGYGFSGEPAELGWDVGRVAQAWSE